MAETDLLFSLIPALGAILISVYNWYTLQQGGKVKPLRIVNYGIWSVNSKDKMVKNLFMPVILDNIAIKSALVTDINISFKHNGQEKEIRINRRIELTMPPGSMSGLGLPQFKLNFTKELVPFYPIPVPGQEGIMVMLDCVDLGDVIELDKEHVCKIVVQYGNGKKSAIEFPFTLTTEQFTQAQDALKWFRT